MKVQKTNYGYMPKLREKNGANQSFSAAFPYAPRAYKEGREAVQVVFKNATGWQDKLLKLYEKRGENLNNIITAFGTALVAPFFIRYNPVSREDKDSKAYSAWRQPISAVITLAGQLFVIGNYNKMLDKHAATAGVADIDLSAKPPASVLKKQAKLDYQKYSAECLLNGVEHQKRKEWIKNRIIHLQDEAFYSKLKELRNNPELDVSYAKIVRPKDISKERDNIFRSVLLENGINEKTADLFKDYESFVKKGKKICKSNNLNFDIICDTIGIRAKDNVLARVKASVEAEAKVKLAVSDVHAEMVKALDAKKLEIMQKYSSAELENEAKLGKIDKKIEKAAKEIFDDMLSKLKAEVDEIAKKTDANKTETEHITEHVYNKLVKQGCIKNIKNHGETYEKSLRSVMIKKMLNTQINLAEENLKSFKDKSGMLVALAILPITCTILNWAYPKIMKKFFPRLSGIKEAKKAELREARAAELAQEAKVAQEAKEAK